MLERPKKTQPKTIHQKPKPKPKPMKNTAKSSYTVNRDGYKGQVDVGKWRCKICSFLNEKDLEKCHMCGEQKTVMKEAPAKFGGGSTAN